MAGQFPPDNPIPAPGAAGNILTSNGSSWTSEAPAAADPPWDYGLVYQTTTASYGWGYLGSAMVFTGTAGSFTASGSVPFGGAPGVATAIYNRTGTNPSLRAGSGIVPDMPSCAHQIACQSVSGTGGTISLGWWASAGDVAAGAIQGLGLVSAAAFSSTTWRVCYNRGAGLVQVADTGIARDGTTTPGRIVMMIGWDELTRELRTMRADTGETVTAYLMPGASPRDGTSINVYPLIAASGVTTPNVNLDFMRTRGRVGGGQWSA